MNTTTIIIPTGHGSGAGGYIMQGNPGIFGGERNVGIGPSPGVFGGERNVGIGPSQNIMGPGGADPDPDALPAGAVLAALRAIDPHYYAIAGGQFWNAAVGPSINRHSARCARLGPFFGYGATDREAALDVVLALGKAVGRKAIPGESAKTTPEQWQALAEAISRAIDILGPQDAP